MKRRPQRARIIRSNSHKWPESQTNNDGAAYSVDSHHRPPLSVYHDTSAGRNAQSTDHENNP